MRRTFWIVLSVFFLGFWGVSGYAGLFLVKSVLHQQDPFNPENCFSLEFVRYQLGGAIFDFPSSVDVSGVGPPDGMQLDLNTSLEFFSLALIEIPLDYRREHGIDQTKCQRKEFVPIMGAERSTNIRFGKLHTENNATWQRYSIWPSIYVFNKNLKDESDSSFYAERHAQAFDYSRFDEIELVHVDWGYEPTPGNHIRDIKFIFQQGDRRQTLDCSQYDCSGPIFIVDGVLLLVRVSVSRSGEDWRDPRVFIPEEQVLRTAIPVIEELRKFRNTAVEAEYQ